MSKSNLRKGLWINGLSVLCNAIAPIFSKFALIEMSPYEAAFWVTTGTTALTLIYRIFRPHQLTCSMALKVLPMSIVNAIGILCLYASLSRLDPVTFGFMGRLYVVFTTLLSVLILKEAIGFIEGALVGSAVIGSLLVSVSGEFSAESLLGIAFAVAYTFAFALSNMMIKVKVKSTDPMAILLVNNTVAATAIGVLFLISGSGMHVTMSSASYLIGAVTFTFAALAALFIGFRHLSFRLANLIRATSPLVVAAVSWPFFPVALTRANLAGGTLLIASIAGLSWIEHKK